MNIELSLISLKVFAESIRNDYFELFQNFLNDSLEAAMRKFILILRLQDGTEIERIGLLKDISNVLRILCINGFSSLGKYSDQRLSILGNKMILDFLIQVLIYLK